jgi:hypothetical protein
MVSEQNPLRLILRALGLWFRGRVRFRVRNLESITLKDQGETFAAFRKVEVDPSAAVQQLARPPGAIFQVRFRFKNLSVNVNRWLSLIPIPLIVAQKGFRSKTWFLGEQSGAFIGLYEFDSVEDAEAYWDSLPLRMMKRRAAPGSLSHKVIGIKQS